MAFLVEDGTGVAGANSYIEIAFADDYFTDRNNADWVGTDLEKQGFIILATDYVELRFGPLFIGEMEFPDTQTLSFPRVVSEVSLGIPTNLKKAISEYALIAKSRSLIVNPDFTNTGLFVKFEENTVGPVSKKVSYDTTKQVTGLSPFPTADTYLYQYCKATQGKVIRA